MRPQNLQNPNMGKSARHPSTKRQTYAWQGFNTILYTLVTLIIYHENPLSLAVYTLIQL